jgi:hypothetical protein
MGWIGAALLFAAPLSAETLGPPGKQDPDGLTLESFRAAMPEYFSRAPGSTITPEALPDVIGPGAVLTVGNIFMKVTNWGHVGNLFQNLSSDPSSQWPGASGIEYLSSIRLAVGAVNTVATDPTAVRRVSYLLEWRPETLEPDDRIYRAYDGIVNGTRFVNDDGDTYIDVQSGETLPKIDEDFLDGRDNDGDGRVDEDFAALGQQMYSLVMWDNTVQAINTTFNEKHVPLGLECRQKTWAYSIRGLQDFNIVEYEIFNRSGHELDSVCVGFLVDMDSGPYDLANYFQDDLDLPFYPHGEFPVIVGNRELPDNERIQPGGVNGHDPLIQDVSQDSALCPRVNLRVNGFSIADDNGDEERTTGIPSFLLIDHTTDPLGVLGPKRVGFRAFRSFSGGTPFAQGGNPLIDQQRFQFLAVTEDPSDPAYQSNIDPVTGFVSRNFVQGETKGDYVQWVAVGSPLDMAPGTRNGLWRLADGQSITVTIAFAISQGSYQLATQYTADYDRFLNGLFTAGELLNKYPSLENALACQTAFEGVHALRQEGFLLNDYHGRESRVRRPLGAPDSEYVEECPNREPRRVIVNGRTWSWFDFDCNYCTGPWNAQEAGNEATNGGLFHKTWNATAPPPNPNLNVASSYNYTDNPNRRVTPSGDRQVVLAWDNLSEITADPASNCFDFRGYRVWKVSDWTRPVGSAGPSESDWKLVGEFRLFDYERNGVPIQRNYTIDPVTGEKQCPMVFVPNAVRIDSVTGQPVQGAEIPICLDRGDLWDHQSGEILKPDTSFRCVPKAGSPGGCDGATGGIVFRNQPAPEPCKVVANQVYRPYFPVGRYRYVDNQVKNGFVYFYSVTAFDSTAQNNGSLVITTELEGRRTAVEGEGVAPQSSTATGTNVWVVPNPYRGYNDVQSRPSSWDLTPNASDPTGTHIDFFGLPAGQWTIRIYTVSGDLVSEIRSTDPVNESLRSPQAVPGTSTVLPGYNRQQDSPNDGQARWNLISRNGQDIVSGIYLFTVESSQGTQRGKFVVIR